MAKMSIYLPDELKERMDSRPTENWSGIAQRAFELQINSTQKGGDDMNAIVERLRASKAKIEEIERPSWTGNGRKWASDNAEFEELARVAELDFEGYDEDNDRLGDIRLALLAQAILGNPHPDRSDIRELAEFLTGNERVRPSGRQVGWFVEGAKAVWDEVKDQI